MQWGVFFITGNVCEIPESFVVIGSVSHLDADMELSSRNRTEVRKKMTEMSNQLTSRLRFKNLMHRNFCLIHRPAAFLCGCQCVDQIVHVCTWSLFSVLILIIVFTSFSRRLKETDTTCT